MVEQQLKLELNDRDQEHLDNDVEIACVPETKGEGLPHIIMTLSTKLGLNLTVQDFVSATRVDRVISPLLRKYANDASSSGIVSSSAPVGLGA